MWVECPAEGRPAVRVDEWTAQCPECAFTFSTVVDEPVMPPHWLSLDGEVVRVGGRPR